MSEALRLADALDNEDHMMSSKDIVEAAAELRRLHALVYGQHSELYGLRAKLSRLHALNAELVEALKGLADEFVKTFPVYYASEPWRHETNAPLRKARAALAKAEASK